MDGPTDSGREREREMPIKTEIKRNIIYKKTEITRRENGRSDVWCTARLYKPV
jgi:hypothetical protein